MTAFLREYDHEQTPTVEQPAALPVAAQPIVFGLFDNDHDAEQAIVTLYKQGFSEDQLSIVALDGYTTVPQPGKPFMLGLGSLIVSGPIATAVRLLNDQVTGTKALANALMAVGLPETENDSAAKAIVGGAVFVAVHPGRLTLASAEQVIKQFHARRYSMTETQLQTQQTQIGIAEPHLDAVCELLSRDLADLYVLYTKTRNYHWNVTGPNFKALHELFQEQYTLMEQEIDELAERIRALGRNTIGTLAEFGQLTRLQEHPREYPDAQHMVANLLSDHEHLIRSLREDVDTTADSYHDMGTSDFLTGLMEAHEKMAWMLRAYLH